MSLEKLNQWAQSCIGKAKGLPAGLHYSATEKDNYIEASITDDGNRDNILGRIYPWGLAFFNEVKKMSTMLS